MFRSEFMSEFRVRSSHPTRVPQTLHTPNSLLKSCPSSSSLRSRVWVIESRSIASTSFSSSLMSRLCISVSKLCSSAAVRPSCFASLGFCNELSNIASSRMY